MCHIPNYLANHEEHHWNPVHCITLLQLPLYVNNHLQRFSCSLGFLSCFKRPWGLSSPLRLENKVITWSNDIAKHLFVHCCSKRYHDRGTHLGPSQGSLWGSPGAALYCCRAGLQGKHAAGLPKNTLLSRKDVARC